LRAGEAGDGAADGWLGPPQPASASARTAASASLTA
jgi:hypothetical protein